MKPAQRTVLDEDLARVGVALRRAARQARKIAARTRTPLVIYKKGRVIRMKIEEETSG